MALAFTLRADDPDSTNGTTFATPAFTPSADAGIIAGVLTSRTSGASSVPTLDLPSWLSGSWTQEVTLQHSDTATRLTVFSGRTVSSPASAALTVSVATSHDGCITQVVDVTDEDVADFVLQPKIVEGSAATSGAITLDGALAGSTSACLAFIAHLANEAQAPTGGETELADSGHAIPVRRMSCQREINDTTSGASWTTSANWLAAALEVKQAGVSANEALYPFIGGGYYPDGG